MIRIIFAPLIQSSNNAFKTHIVKRGKKLLLVEVEPYDLSRETLAKEFFPYNA